jgi:hypothetical protein
MPSTSLPEAVSSRFSATDTSWQPPGAARADRDVVLDVAGQPVDLVDHDDVDVAVPFDPLQHLEQLGPVGGTGGLAAVDVLVDQRPPLIADARHARLSLGGAKLSAVPCPGSPAR